MALRVITTGEVANKGVIALADVPGIGANELKFKFEEVVRETVIPALNENAQNSYDKNEVDEKLAQAVFDAGLADMRQSVYDEQGRGQDVFAYADAAAQAAEQSATQAALGRVMSQKAAILYVSTKGKDATADGSEAKPFRSVAAALGTVPPVLVHNVVVMLGVGSFKEVIELVGRAGGGKLILRGAGAMMAGGTVVQGVSVRGCSCEVQMTNLCITSSYTDYEGDVQAVACAKVDVISCRIVGTGTREAGVCFDNASGVVERTWIEGKKYAMSCWGGSLAATDNTGENNTYCFNPAGGVILTYGTEPQAVTRKSPGKYEMVNI